MVALKLTNLAGVQLHSFGLRVDGMAIWALSRANQTLTMKISSSS
jgi:hypothetical protein